MQIKLLQTFKAVMETGSTLSAAKELHVTQSAVSRRIAQLEEELGLSLFVRDRGRLAPTKECLLLKNEIFGIADKGNQLSELARELRQGNSTEITLRIAVPASLTLSIIPRILNEYLEIHDRVRMELLTGPYDSIERMLADGRAEIGFLRIPVLMQGLKVTPIITARTVCVMRKDHPLAEKTHVSFEDLKDVPLILLGRRRMPRREVDETFWQAGLVPNIRVEAHSVMSACSLAASGLGVTLVNELMAKDYDHLSVTFRPVKPELPHRFAFAVNEKTPISNAAQSFMDLCDIRFKELLQADR